MTGMPSKIAVLPILLIMSGGVVQAAPEDDYVALMTALEIDKACIALKYMEFTAVRGIAQRYLESTSQHVQSLDGRLSPADYDAWRVGLDEQARTAATAAGCTQAAMSHVLTAKAAASDQLYQGLLLAFHFDSLSDFDRIPLDGHKKQTAMGYEAYLRQLYGQSFDAFAQRQRDAVVQMIPVEDPGLSTWSWSPDAEQHAGTLWDLQIRAAAAMSAVQFEVTAEANGYFVRPYFVTEVMVVPSLVRPEIEGSLPIIRGPSYQLIKDGDELVELYSVAAMLPDRRIGLLFYGDTATKHMQSPTVRLYVPQQPYPDGTSGITAFNNASFRDNALVFEGNWASDGCMGAPCYDFPVEATDALVADPAGTYAELFVSFTPNDQPPPFDETGRERFDSQWMLWWADSVGAQR
ncbi:hypothetical protein [Devosia sediminis]|uniref:Uncharacterized protein n=1 Tax=Devosia sediminis TaxID=2798801 RepID=A0A934MLX6_9HYPH|nr:hypothetical protein [Devosia sediminis]MBJ3785610.1 hypothetical protein [Devosia sediminis]